MSVLAASMKSSGLLWPLPSSNAVSSSATTITQTVTDIWETLAESLAVRNTAESAIAGLRDARVLAAAPNWDGYGARPLNLRAYFD